MSIDGVNILQGWMSDENGEFKAESLTELEKKAAEGNEDAQINLCALKAENAENVEENLAFLEKHASTGNDRASLFLGVLYHEGIAKNDSDGSQKILLPIDEKKSESYLENVDVEKLPNAALMLGMNTWFKCCVCVRNESESEQESDYEKPTADDYIKGEKRLISLYEIAEKNAIENWKEMASKWLSSLYAIEDTPVYNLEKSKYWENKA